MVRAFVAGSFVVVHATAWLGGFIAQSWWGPGEADLIQAVAEAAGREAAARCAHNLFHSSLDEAPRAHPGVEEQRGLLPTGGGWFVFFARVLVLLHVVIWTLGLAWWLISRKGQVLFQLGHEEEERAAVSDTEVRSLARQQLDQVRRRRHGSCSTMFPALVYGMKGFFFGVFV